MARQARKKSGSGIYHVMMRGINKQKIFEDEKDNEKFLNILKDCKEKSDFKLMAYCLIKNHFHLLIRVEKEEPELIFRRIGVRYVYWFNEKYSRTGHLFQDRYKSEPVEDDKYFLTVLRYIHQNPIKAELCKEIAEYKWSSYNDYLNDFGISDTEYGLQLFHKEKETARMLFKKYLQEDEKIKCLDVENKKQRISDVKAINIIKQICEKEKIIDLNKMTQETRNDVIRKFRQSGISIRQISKITGIGMGIVRKI